MAHIAKFSRGAMGHMLSHYDRSKTPGDNIDTSKTHLNYNLAAEHQPQSQINYIHQRLNSVKLHNRKDVKVLCDWVVTAPKDLPQEIYPKFFSETYNYLSNKYGKKNVVSAYVHYDEVTPHMHFAFVPVVADKKKGGYKVSAKECITRYDLQHFHGDLQAYLENKLKQPVNLLNEATKEGNKSIEELKRGTAIEKLSKIASESIKAQEAIKILEKQKNSLEGQINALESEIEVAVSQKSNLNTYKIKNIAHSKALFGDKQLIDTKDFNELVETASLIDNILVELKKSRKIIATADEIIKNANDKADSIISDAIISAKEKKSEIEREIKSLENKKITLNERLSLSSKEAEIDRMKRIIKSNPNLEIMYKEAEKQQKNKHNKKYHNHSL